MKEHRYGVVYLSLIAAVLFGGAAGFFFIIETFLYRRTTGNSLTDHADLEMTLDRISDRLIGRIG